MTLVPLSLGLCPFCTLISAQRSPPRHSPESPSLADAGCRSFPATSTRQQSGRVAASVTGRAQPHHSAWHTVRARQTLGKEWNTFPQRILSYTSKNILTNDKKKKSYIVLNNIGYINTTVLTIEKHVYINLLIYIYLHITHTQKK